MGHGRVSYGFDRHPGGLPCIALPEPALGAPIAARACEVCGKAIHGRKEKKVCSGWCRITLCRQRRHGALLDRLHAALFIMKLPSP